MDKRIKRIYPAYFTVVVLAGLTLWPLSTVPISQYFGFGFWKYLGANLLFMNFFAETLPGVFSSFENSAVNGALWTLKIEVAFYLFVPIIHYLCRRFGTKGVMVALFSLSLLWKYGFTLLDTLYGANSVFHFGRDRSIFAELAVQFPAQLTYFSAGILLYLYFDKLKSHFPAIVCLSAVLYLTDHFITHGTLDVFWISGIVFVFAFWSYLGNFSKYGDFSYGTYIVHWPVLQTLIAFGAVRLGPLAFLFLSVSSIFLAAFLMWNLVEKRFLATSSHYRQMTMTPAPALGNSAKDVRI